jgi:hypothetical protein
METRGGVCPLLATERLAYTLFIFSFAKRSIRRAGKRDTNFQ